MKLILLPQASGELADAVEYYEGEEAGLGERLWREADDHLRWIAANATLPRLRPGDYRVLFELEGRTVTVYAVGNRKDIYR